MNGFDTIIISAYAFTLLMLAGWIIHAWWQHRMAKRRLLRVQSQTDGTMREDG